MVLARTAPETGQCALRVSSFMIFFGFFFSFLFFCGFGQYAREIPCKTRKDNTSPVIVCRAPSFHNQRGRGAHTTKSCVSGNTCLVDMFFFDASLSVISVPLSPLFGDNQLGNSSEETWYLARFAECMPFTCPFCGKITNPICADFSEPIASTPTVAPAVSRVARNRKWCGLGKHIAEILPQSSLNRSVSALLLFGRENQLGNSFEEAWYLACLKVCLSRT